MAGRDDAEDRDPVREKVWFCPSAQPALEGSMILGVVQQNQQVGHVTLLEKPVRVTEGTVLAFAGNQQQATGVFRFAAPCQKQDCRNWSNNSCRVAERVVQILPANSDELPNCRLRSICLWFHQEGGSACKRCTLVLTDNPAMEIALNSGSAPRPDISVESGPAGAEQINQV
jgi:hypothetical protein